MKYVVKISIGQFDYWLRGTVWAGAEERATRFDSRELAQAGLEKAKKFTKPATYKLAKIEEIAE